MRGEVEPHPRGPGFRLNGRWQYCLRSILALYWSSLVVTIRRLVRGPLLPGWSWTFEAATHYLKAQCRAAFDMPDIEKGREYLDALVFNSPALARVRIESVTAPVRGHWYEPETQEGGRTLLYLHGGGFAYYAKGHQNLIALVALTARARTFAPDYRLIPESPFPAQLEDARAAYRWLLDSGIAPGRLVVAGDSAGGNLVLGLAVSLRDSQAPLPSLAICLSPWTDVANSGASMTGNEKYDWVERRMAMKWAQWLCHGADPRSPLISPIRADLGGLSPIYVQAGDAEILYDMIRAFVGRAKEQGVEVTLDVWKHMNHDFQAYGEFMPESKEALERIGQMIDDNIK
ncbi:MAG TPA: alpha/beta hydrolase [Isosphaeraceae bacterium]|nr:alpha/beta hydrolase [Isosphaeraceae bacterium]